MFYISVKAVAFSCSDDAVASADTSQAIRSFPSKSSCSAESIFFGVFGFLISFGVWDIRRGSSDGSIVDGLMDDGLMDDGLMEDEMAQ